MTDFAGAFWLAIRSRIDYTAGALGRRLHHLIDIALASTGFSKAVLSPPVTLFVGYFRLGWLVPNLCHVELRELLRP